MAKILQLQTITQCDDSLVKICASKKVITGIKIYTKKKMKILECKFSFYITRR